MDSSSSDLHGKDPPLFPPPIWVADSLFGSENSSSGLSTPFGSVGSTRTETESDDDEGEDFLAELTRQMAGYMLQDEDDESNFSVEDRDNTLQHSPKLMEDLANSSAKSASDSDSANCAMRAIEVYTTKEQSSVRKQSNPSPRGRRAAAKTESTHQRVELAAEADYTPKKGRRRGSGHGGGRAHTLRNGSGMQAVFLGGYGSVTGASSSGTGVFIPRGCNYHGQTEPKKNSGCSTVLIPTRVMQALQLHFSNMEAKSQSNSYAASPTNHLAQYATWNKTEESLSQIEQRSDVETQPATNDQEMQLPQEWTY